jgi:hypothetical protein
VAEVRKTSAIKCGKITLHASIKIYGSLSKAFLNVAFLLVAPRAMYDQIKKVDALPLSQWLAEATYVWERR